LSESASPALAPWGIQAVLEVVVVVGGGVEWVVVGGGVECVVVGGGVEWVVGGGVEWVVVGAAGAAEVGAAGAEAWLVLDGAEAVVAVFRALCFALVLWARWWAWWVTFLGMDLVAVTVPVVAGDRSLVDDEAPQAAASSPMTITATKEMRICRTRMSLPGRLRGQVLPRLFILGPCTWAS
jgi:hypothetical protein